MSIEIRNELTTALGEYACISIAFHARALLDVELRNGGLGGFRLVERSVTKPWTKDYAECDEGPTSWAKRFDISNWGLVSAWNGATRIGGAVIVFDTPALHSNRTTNDLDASKHAKVRSKGKRNRSSRSSMQRVLVIGSGGAGKSTFARRLGEATGLPVVHLDACYWRPGWDPTPKVEWTCTVDEIAARAEWIMDGNYGGTLDRRLAACDTVIFLDLPRAVCLWRVLWRSFRYRGRSRPDMAPGCPERITLEFVQWIWTYPHARRPDILHRLDALPAAKRVVILESTRAVARFLRNLGASRERMKSVKPSHLVEGPPVEDQGMGDD